MGLFVTWMIINFVDLGPKLGEGSKTPITAFCRDGGGGTPLCRDFFSVTFLAGRLPWWGGGGYPPLPWLKNLLKIGPKTVFFRQKTPFLAKKFQAACRDGGGGGTPLCRDFFPVNFLAGRLPWWGEGRGGVPPSRQKAVIGVFEPFPKQALSYNLSNIQHTVESWQ